MKPLSLTLYLTLTCSLGFAQPKPDSLKQALKIATSDSVRHNTCVELYFYYQEVNRDSAFLYAEKRLALAKQNNYKLAEAAALIGTFYQYVQMGRYAASYQNLLLALKIAGGPNNEEKNGWRIAQLPIPGKDRLSILALTHYGLSILMRDTENPKKEIFHLKEVLRIARQNNFIDRQMLANMNMSIAYLKINELDSALYFAKEADVFSKNPMYKGVYRGINIANLGDIYLQKGDKQQAKKYYYEGFSLAIEKNNQNSIAQINHKLIQFFLRENEKDSALSYAVKNLGIIKSIRTESTAINTGIAFEDVYLAYKLNNQVDSAYKYQGLTLIAKDNFYKIRIKNLADFQNLSLEEAMRLENLEKEKIEIQSKIRTYTLLSVLTVLSIIGFILYLSNRQKQKANAILQTQKDEINEKSQQLQISLETLQSTQAQLIQSEKMASLGELTAGIAHEIQNPLNFVNNFSELNGELVKEIKQELAIGNEQLAKGNTQSAISSWQQAGEIINDIESNSEKINHHGKRAESIVKGMLEHSRKSTGVKEPTDINKLCDEFVRLSYHGLRAKDKDFNCDYKLDLDPNMPLVNVVSQDIGRVLLNIINNAFWACSEKSGSLKLESQEVYKPLVTLTTHFVASLRRCEICISDNGPGIPSHIKDKIFQPFFTTKPTGQGTGLGLSLAYDIVKAHGGTIAVSSDSDHGTTFIIQLPIIQSF